MSNEDKQTYFVRKASGLVREFGTFDVFVFNTLGFALGLVLTLAPGFLGVNQPNANVYLVLTIGTVLTVFNGLTYGLFAAAMRGSGGDYLYIGRTLHPALGFIANWGFTWSQFFGLGAYTAWCVSETISPGFSTIGYILKEPALISLGKFLARPSMQWMIGTILLGSVLFIQLAGTRLLKRFLNSLFFVALAGTIAIMIVFLMSSRESFLIEFNKFMLSHAGLSDAYQSIIKLAEGKGFLTGQPTSLLATIMALPIGYWCFIGFTYSVYIGGEVREPQKSQTIGVIGSLIFGYIMYMIILGQYYSIVGRDFNNAVAVVKNIENNPLVAGGSMTFFAGLLSKNVFVNILIALSNFLWYYLLLIVMVTFCARNIFAWSFDKIMPEPLTRMSNKTNIPWISVLAIVGVAEIFLIVQAFLGLDFINYIAMFSVCFFITGIAAVIFPYKKKHLFEGAPAVVQKKILGIPVIVLAGIGNMILFAVVLWSSLTNPGLSGVKGQLPLWILIAVYGLGVIICAIRKAQGFDFRNIFDEIPAD